MQYNNKLIQIISIIFFILIASTTTSATGTEKDTITNEPLVQLGPRPYFLIDNMDESELKRELQKCSEGPFYKTDLSIGHRGAPLLFPEHTRESYVAAARMGAGILECDVTFTKDMELVCRHSQCDLHTTTNILAIPELAAKCSESFTPAVLDSEGNLIKKASAKCCTSDITLAEFKTLCGKMDASNPWAMTVESYMQGTANFRTDLYSTCGTLLSHRESIALFQELGTRMTPELKAPSVDMPYQGIYSQSDYAQQLIDEYREAGVKPKDVFPQSFNLGDVLYWIDNEPQFGKQAVYLDGRYSNPEFDHTNPLTWEPTMEQLVAQGVRIIAPPMWMLLRLDENNKIIPSLYAEKAKEAGLTIITWSLERSGLLKDKGGWYYQTVADAINNDGDMMVVLDVLVRDVGVIGVFTDWPATVTYYANCIGKRTTDLDNDGDTDRDDANIIRQYLGQPLENCLSCDIDGDGKITISDARKLMQSCSRTKCASE